MTVGMRIGDCSFKRITKGVYGLSQWIIMNLFNDLFHVTDLVGGNFDLTARN